MTAWKGAIMDAKERIIEQLKRSGCRVTKQRLMLEDGTVLDLPEDKWTAVIKSGLDACGFSGGQNVRNITLKEA